jgi:hypothetical protein
MLIGESMKPCDGRFESMSASRDVKANGRSADKAPFAIWIIVEIATHLLSTLCANYGHANYVAIGANVP